MDIDSEYGYMVIAGFVVLGLILMLRPLSQALYTLSKNWQAAAFFIVCLISGGLFALYAQGAGVYVPFDFSPKPTEGQVEMAISDCKGFLTAKNNHGDFNLILEEGSFYRPQTEADLWDTCATVFGQNYWKNDITVNGQNGGKLLCNLYHQGTYNSANVDAWCDSVLEKAEEPKANAGPKENHS